VFKDEENLQSHVVVSKENIAGGEFSLIVWPREEKDGKKKNHENTSIGEFKPKVSLFSINFFKVWTFWLF
jgi:hypothetical protein